MTFAAAESTAHPQLRKRREEFRRWLLCHRRVGRKLNLRSLLDLYGGELSVSSAYRVALAAGVRGQRRNKTRYEAFWATINWDLSDTTLQRIWGVTRGNLRQRRVRLGVGDPAFNARLDANDPRFVLAVAQERRRAAKYTGPRPH